MVNQTNKSASERAQVDKAAYNPNALEGTDDADYNPEGTSQPVGARGADSQPTGRNFAQEDRETGSSESTGKIPRGTSRQ